VFTRHREAAVESARHIERSRPKRVHPHREAVSAAVAIHNNISALTLDCFASLAMTVTSLSLKLL
jgi:hypothetical protein